MRDGRATKKTKLNKYDDEAIKAMLNRFISVYQIALKYQVSYNTMMAYIKSVPELLQAKKDAEKGMTEFVQSNLMRKIVEGDVRAMCFYLERKGGWTQKQEIDTNAPMPNIVLGMIPQSEIPKGLGEPDKIGEGASDGDVIEAEAVDKTNESNQDDLNDGEDVDEDEAFDDIVDDSPATDGEDVSFF